MASAWPPDGRVANVMPRQSAGPRMGLVDADWLPEAVCEYGQPYHSPSVEALHHVRREPGLYHRLLECIAVDEHGR